MDSAVTLRLLNAKLSRTVLQLAQENASDYGVSCVSSDTERRLRRAVKYLTKRVASQCQGAGVECPCGRDHGDGFDSGEYGHCY